MFVRCAVHAVSRIVKVTAYRSSVLRAMATGKALNDAVAKRRVALITGITGQVRSLLRKCMDCNIPMTTVSPPFAGWLLPGRAST